MVVWSVKVVMIVKCFEQSSIEKRYINALTIIIIIITRGVYSSQQLEIFPQPPYFQLEKLPQPEHVKSSDVAAFL